MNEELVCLVKILLWLFILYYLDKMCISLCWELVCDELVFY